MPELEVHEHSPLSAGDPYTPRDLQNPLPEGMGTKNPTDPWGWQPPDGKTCARTPRRFTGIPVPVPAYRHDSPDRLRPDRLRPDRLRLQGRRSPARPPSGGAAVTYG
ncbi:hypothetical protein GCM10017687_60530 [Streptomyces echinatus]